MITHVVLFRWSSEPSTWSAALAAELPAMMDEIGTVESFDYGTDLGRHGSAYHFALVVRVTDENTLQAYEEHAAHQRVIHDVVNPGLGPDGSLAAVQFASFAAAVTG